MRFGLWSREALAISLLTLFVVATTTAVHLSQLSRVVVEEAARQAELAARQIYAQSSRTLARGGARNAEQALRRDAELRGLLEATVGYSPHLLYALVADRTGKTLLHTQRQREGAQAPAWPTLQELAAAGPLDRFVALSRSGRTYEVILPIQLNERPFGTIRLGISTTLLKRELNAALRQSLTLAAVALPLGWLVAMALARLVLRPVRVLATQLERIRRGEFDAAGAVSLPDEFQELSSQLQRLGRELQADRIATLSERAHLQQVVHQLEDGVIFLNEERAVLFFNRAAEAVVGRPLEQAVGRPLAELLGVGHPLRRLVESAWTADAGPRNTTLALPAGPRTREFLVSVFAVRDLQQPMGAVVLLKDLESIKTVQSLVSYSAKLAALGRLTSGIAHEVKNPLNAMMIHLELLREKLDAPSLEVQQSLEVIASEIRRLDRVVQGFLRFMRPQEVAFKALDLNALLGSVAALLEAEWRPRGIRFAFALDPALPRIGADEELLRQAFLNILQNACQAMPDGGTISIRTAQEDHDTVWVSITDEGIGIPAEELDRIFKLYYTTKPDGTGIGLSIVYRIVQMHDGAIEVQSEVGRGTTMIVRLPVRLA